MKRGVEVLRRARDSRRDERLCGHDPAHRWQSEQRARERAALAKVKRGALGAAVTQDVQQWIRLRWRTVTNHFESVLTSSVQT